MHWARMGMLNLLPGLGLRTSSPNAKVQSRHVENTRCTRFCVEATWSVVALPQTSSEGPATRLLLPTLWSDVTGRDRRSRYESNNAN
jgi:hypothetical protein